MLVVPSNISDQTLALAAKHRSKGRIPVLTYYHRANAATITRSSQPMVGIAQNRSFQDERLVEAIFSSHMSPDAVTTSTERVYGSTLTNLIIDARPTTNAMANYAKGAGSENMEYYKNSKKVYLGIDNIHVMRDSLAKVQAAFRTIDEQLLLDSQQEQSQIADISLALQRSHWLKHLEAILQGTLLIVRNVNVHSSHVLVHCSDGWDRTAQLTSLAQICLDPYYRTFEGFAVLIEKDWLSFGHQFQERHGLVHGGPSKFDMTPPVHESTHDLDASDHDQQLADNPRGVPSFWDFTKTITAHFQANGASQCAPIFFQFLDCVWQLQYQNPDRFEFDGGYLAELVLQIFSGTTGTFLFNSERERQSPLLPNKERSPSQSTPSVWDELLPRRGMWRNSMYNSCLDSTLGHGDQGVLFPRPKDVRFSADLFRHSDTCLNALVDAKRLEYQRFHERLAEAGQLVPAKSPATSDTHAEQRSPEEAFQMAARSVRSLFSDGWNRMQEALRKSTENAGTPEPAPKDSESDMAIRGGYAPALHEPHHNPWVSKRPDDWQSFDALSMDDVNCNVRASTKPISLAQPSTSWPCMMSSSPPTSREISASTSAQHLHHELPSTAASAPTASTDPLGVTNL